MKPVTTSGAHGRIDLCGPVAVQYAKSRETFGFNNLPGFPFSLTPPFLFSFSPVMLADDEGKSAPSNSAVEKQEGGQDEGNLESRKWYPIVRRKAHGFFGFIFSHRMIPILKGIFTSTHTSRLRH